jgi:hypothetical protein
MYLPLALDTNQAKLDVFTDNCTPTFCGLQLNEENDEYAIIVGPE